MKIEVTEEMQIRARALLVEHMGIENLFATNVEVGVMRYVCMEVAEELGTGVDLVKYFEKEAAELDSVPYKRLLEWADTVFTARSILDSEVQFRGDQHDDFYGILLAGYRTWWKSFAITAATYLSQRR